MSALTGIMQRKRKRKRKEEEEAVDRTEIKIPSDVHSATLMQSSHANGHASCAHLYHTSLPHFSVPPRFTQSS